MTEAATPRQIDYIRGLQERRSYLRDVAVNFTAGADVATAAGLPAAEFTVSRFVTEHPGHPAVQAYASIAAAASAAGLAGRRQYAAQVREATAAVQALVGEQIAAAATDRRAEMIAALDVDPTMLTRDEASRLIEGLK